VTSGPLAGPLAGPWIERLEAIAVGRAVVAVAGRRDTAEPAAARVHVIPTTLLDGKGVGWSLDGGAAICALAFAGDDLLIGGSDDGRLIAWTSPAGAWSPSSRWARRCDRSRSTAARRAATPV